MYATVALLNGGQQGVAKSVQRPQIQGVSHHIKPWRSVRREVKTQGDENITVPEKHKGSVKVLISESCRKKSQAVNKDKN